MRGRGLRVRAASDSSVLIRPCRSLLFACRGVDVPGVTVADVPLPVAVEKHVALRPAKDLDELHVIEVLEPPKTLAVNRRLEIGFDDQRVTDLQLLV